MNVFVTLLICLASAAVITFCIDMIAQFWQEET